MIVSRGSVYTLVESGTDEEIRKLTSMLTIKMPKFWFSKAYRRGLWDGTKCFLKYDGRSGLHYFLSGFIGKVKEELSVVVREKRTQQKIEIHPRMLKTKEMTGKYSYQFETLVEAVKEKRGILSLATGAGKTSIAVALSVSLPKKVLFVVPTIELMWQTYDSYNLDTNLRVACLGDGESPVGEYDVCVAVYKSVYLTHRVDSSWLTQFKTIFVDECHHACSDEYTNILLGCVAAEYKFGLSGTPHAISEDKVMLLTGLIGPILHKVSGISLTEKGVNAKPIINLHDIPMKGLDRTWPKCYISGVVENLERNSRVVSIIAKALDQGKTCLVLTKRQQHGEVLQELFSQKGYEIPYLDSRNSKGERISSMRGMRSGDMQAVILSKIGEEGLDIPQLDVVVRASGGLTPISTLQALGRGLRGKKDKENIVIYHDFFDLDSGILESHSRQRLSDYEGEGYEIRRIGEVS